MRVLAIVLLLTARAAADHCDKLPDKFADKVAAAEKARDESYAKALAAKKLATWTGDVKFHRRDDDDMPAKKQPGILVGSKPEAELVADKSGTVFRVIRNPQGTRKVYTQCGCAPITHGGAAIRTYYYLMDLPKDVKYGGEVRIEYTDEVPIASWTNRQPNGKFCPQPP